MARAWFPMALIFTTPSSAAVRLTSSAHPVSDPHWSRWGPRLSWYPLKGPGKSRRPVSSSRRKTKPRVLGGGFDVGVFGQFIQGHESADADPGVGLLDAFEFLDVLDVDHAFGRVKVFLHEGDEIGAAGQHVGVSPLGGELRHGL